METQALPISCCKKGWEGKLLSQWKTCQHWWTLTLPKQTPQSKQKAGTARIPPASQRPSHPELLRQIFWWRRGWEVRRAAWRSECEGRGGGGTGVDSEAETTHMNTCLLVKRGWKLKLVPSNLCSSPLRACWFCFFFFFHKREDKCEA